MTCQRPQFAGGMDNGDAPYLLPCDQQARYLLVWTADVLPNPHAPYRERLPRVPVEMAAACCGRHITLTGQQERTLDHTGEWLGAAYAIYEMAVASSNRKVDTKRPKGQRTAAHPASREEVAGQR